MLQQLSKASVFHLWCLRPPLSHLELQNPGVNSKHVMTGMPSGEGLMLDGAMGDLRHSWIKLKLDI